MTTTTDAPTTATVSRHCAEDGPYDPPQGQPLTHAWCTGCACPCHPRRIMRARLTSRVHALPVYVDPAPVLTLADVLLRAGFTPMHAERAVRATLQAGWLPPVPT